jgi:hypothetical protein
MGFGFGLLPLSVMGRVAAEENSSRAGSRPLPQTTADQTGWIRKNTAW